MRIKGAALMARKSIVTKEFGEGAWSKLLADMAQSFASFRQPVLATSTIPYTDFLAFHDELVRRFYGGENRAYIMLGEQSARWAVTEGPYKSFIADKDLEGFVRFFPRTWTTYFIETQSHCTTSINGSGVIEFKTFDLPVWHPYFEMFIVAYFKGALELVCANTIRMKQVRGGSGTGYHYELRVGGR